MNPSGFGEKPSLGVPSTTPQTTHHGYYMSGWCARCGRKRGADGRCSDCDGWWTSPLLTTGGPVIAVGTFFLFLLVSLLNHSAYRPAYGTPQPASAVLAAPLARFTPSPAQPVSAPAAVIPVPAPRLTLPTPVVVPATPSPDEIALAEHMRLVQMADYADAVYRANDRLRAASAAGGPRVAAVAAAPTAAVAFPEPQ